MLKFFIKPIINIFIIYKELNSNFNINLLIIQQLDMIINSIKNNEFNNLKDQNNLFFKNNKIKIYIIIFLYLSLIMLKRKKKKIGIIGLSHGTNIGNNLLKYAIFIKLSELGFDPYIIGFHKKNTNISFINRTVNLRIIKNSFKEIGKDEYDVLMVNSDQTWRRSNKTNKRFYDIGFLRFAKNWNIPKFVYAASLGFDYWTFSKKDEKIAKKLLQNFTGISVREKGSVHLIEKHLNIRPIFVLDPTLLIDKKYYLNIISNYKLNININQDFILTYIFLKEKNTKKFIKNASKQLGYKIFKVKKNDENSIEKFIYGMVNCKAVITNSFHGTIFSIIFNKPFISFIFKDSPKERLISLKETFKLGKRIVEYNQEPLISLLTTPLNLNYTLINSLKIKSINYLKQNLRIK